MMINEIKIEKLFGRFNYDIALKEDGVTILTGPNGYGKSTILRLLKVLREGTVKDILNYLLNLNFRKVDILFEMLEEKISITKDEDGVTINSNKVPSKMIKKYSNNLLKSKYVYEIEEDRLLSIVKKNREDLDLSLSEMKELIYGDFLNQPFYIGKEKSKKDTNILRELKKIKKIIGPIYFIEEQRLIMQKDNNGKVNNVIDVIEELPNKFKTLIRNISSNYSDTANRLDNTYPYRLFNTEVGIDEEEYTQNMNEMTKKFEKLNKYDISEIQYSRDVCFKKEHAKALKVYFDDFNEKYKVYEDFIKKLDLFTNIVNSRLSFKEIKISRENGIIVTDESSLNNELKLEQLSSGEKQEIVLFYDLIFEVPNGVLLLIDEPEISLHIVWQKKFMDDLLKIVEYKNLKVIVATHSPQIINNHWDIQVDLGVLYGNELNKG